MNDRVWFVAKPGAVPVLVKITEATSSGWRFRSWDGGIEDFEPSFGERLQDKPRRQVTQRLFMSVRGEGVERLVPKQIL